MRDQKLVIIKTWKKNRIREMKVNKTLNYYVFVTQKYQKIVTKNWTLYNIDVIIYVT